MSKFKKIIVIKGGISDEFDVSIQTGKEVSNALKKKFDISEIIINSNISNFIEQIEKFKPKAIFNALHGKFGEDGQIQSILNSLKIPYTHSGVITSALAMNKYFSKIIFEKFQIKCPKGEIFNQKCLKKIDLKLPYIIKPINGGSSIGIKKIFKKKDLEYIKESNGNNKQLLIEEYIPGREITVGVLNDKICGITEIIPKDDFYDYESKYVKVAQHIQKPIISKRIKDKLITSTLKAHKILGCNYISRADFRYNDSNDEIYLLEVNTQPGLTKNSLLPEMALQKGIDFPDLCVKILENARCEE